MVSDLRDLVDDGIRLHPRVAYQGLMGSAATLERIARSLPPLTYFRRKYHGAISVIDWDHMLPSQSLMLRIFGYYDQESLSVGQESFDDRLEEIGRADKYPEFDVPDFDQVAADEAYEVTLDLDGSIGGTRLTSTWRRDIPRKEARLAVEIAQRCHEFKALSAETTNRAAFLGDLEAVSWTPPCESEHLRWTIDVWYLLEFDGRVGTGRSFLVDVEDRKVITSRDFQIRTG